MATSQSRGKSAQAKGKPPSAAKPRKNPRGRPPSYKPEYAHQVRKLCLLGATDEQMAGVFGVSVQTLNSWKTDHPEFLESMLDGKDKADAEIAHSLYHRAKGYSHDAVKIMAVDKAVVQVPFIERYPPDTAAASLWLRNRQPKLWRDKMELTGADGKDLIPQVDDNDLARRIAFVLAKATHGDAT